MIRVLIASPYPTTRAGLAAFLTRHDQVEVAGETGNIDDLIQLAETTQPDAIVIDPGEAAIGWLGEDWGLPAGETTTLPPIVLLADSLERDEIAGAIESGIGGLLSREATSEEIVGATQAVIAGLVAVDQRVARSLTAGIEPERRPELDLNGEHLTNRELEILQLISQGFPNKAIAAELGISEHTVKFHVGSILDKLGAASRSEALARAARAGLLIL